jgi:hypothetical protein
MGVDLALRHEHDCHVLVRAGFTVETESAFVEVAQMIIRWRRLRHVDGRMVKKRLLALWNITACRPASESELVDEPARQEQHRCGLKSFTSAE